MNRCTTNTKDCRWQTRFSITEVGERKTFHDRAKYQQYLCTNSALKKALEGKFQLEEINHNPKNPRRIKNTKPVIQMKQKENHTIIQK